MGKNSGVQDALTQAPFPNDSTTKPSPVLLGVDFDAVSSNTTHCDKQVSKMDYRSSINILFSNKLFVFEQNFCSDSNLNIIFISEHNIISERSVINLSKGKAPVIGPYEILKT